jgi:DNA-binding CsgD family transcriptional regulator
MKITSSTRDATLTTARRSLLRAALMVEKVLSCPVAPPRRARITRRWNVVDRFEHQGHCYIVARAIGEAAVDGLGALTKCERRVVAAASGGSTTKEIAYALGLAAATVRVLLMRAIRRCRVRSRDDLIRLWRTGEPPSIGSPGPTQSTTS